MSHKDVDDGGRLWGRLDRAALAGLAALAAVVILAGAAAALSIQPHTPLSKSDFFIGGGKNDGLPSALDAGGWTEDGMDDVLVCSAYNNSCWLFFGTPAVGGNARLTKPAVIFVGAYGGWGSSAAFIGDVNGDNREDIAIGAPASTGSGGVVNGGSVWIFLSRGGAWTGSLGYYEADSTVFGAGADDFFGSSIAPAGDVDGDGYADLWVGAPEHSEGATKVGAAYLILGRPSWPTELSSASAALRILGTAADGAFGSVLKGEGDLNADGNLDLLTSTTGYRDASANAVGAAFAFLGPLPRDGRTIDASQAAVTFVGNSMVEPLGASLALANNFVAGGPGGVYVLIGTSLFSNGTSAGGSVYIYKVSSWACCQTLNTWDAAGLLYTFEAGDMAGTALAAGADIDGNGIEDAVVGAPRADFGNKTDLGRATIVYGGEPSSNPYLLSNSTSAIEGSANYSLVGALLVLCDFNGDGNADIMVAAPGDNLTGLYTGSVYGFLGRPRNRAPTAELNTTGVFYEGALVLIRAILEDLDDDDLTWQWVGQEQADSYSGTGLRQLSLFYADEGRYTIFITVSDGELYRSAVISFTVLNAPPTCELRPVKEFVEGIAGDISLLVTEPGRNDFWNVTWWGPDGMTFTRTRARYQPPLGSFFALGANLTDNDGGIGSCELVVDVVNVAPTASLTGPTLLYEGDTGTYTSSVNDPGIDDRFAFNWTGVVGNPQGYAFLWVPNHPGLFTITLNVTDLDDGSDVTNISVRVLSLPPDVALILPSSPVEGDPLNLTVKQYSGQTYDPLVIIWQVCAPGFPVGLVWSIPRAVPGEFCVVVTAIDDDGDNRTYRATLNVSNRAPVASVRTTPSGGVAEGAEVWFEAVLGPWETSTSTEVQYQWFLDGELAGSKRNISLIAPAGTHRMMLVATDKQGAVSRFNVSVNVENIAPAVRISGPSDLLPGAIGNWSAAASDASGKAPSLTWDVDGITIAQGTSFTWSSRVQGPHIVRVTADDGKGGISVATLLVSVEPPPPISAGLDLRWAAIPLGAAAAFAAGILVGAWAYGRWKEKRIDPERESKSIKSMWKR